MEWLNTHVSSTDTSLQQAPEVLKAIGMDTTINIGDSMIYDRMSVVLSKPAVGGKRIGIEGRPRLNMLADFDLQCRPLPVRDDNSLHLAAALQKSHHGGLVLTASPGDTTLAFANVHIAGLATNEGFIRFHFATELRSEERRV